MKNNITKPALLEIGVEEIPARFMTPALNQFASLLESGLTEASLPFAKIEVFGTPRRLAALIHNVAVRSNDREDVLIGPPPKAARNENGEWTQAALGFAKAQGVSVENLIVKNTPKGERLTAVRTIKGQKAEQVLKELFPAVINGLTFPKTMVWDQSQFRFPRPIRWIVALFNGSVIRFKLGDVTSDRKTVGLLSLGGLRILISKPEKYKSILQGRCILVDPEVRKKTILSQLDSVAKKNKTNPISTPEHIEEVVYLTEYPSSILGKFPEEYLKLPREILVMVLKKHQKFFPLESSKGQLSNLFIGFRNGPSESQEEVREGYERVVNARLADAQFFVEKDSQLDLHELASKLSGVGFHEKLGTMWDKTLRVKSLVKRLGGTLGLEADVIDQAERAAHLSKADLLTQIVGELPELQGVAGRFYSEKKERPDVSRAIEEHYWPITSEGVLPPSSVSALVALADKIDTLAADFSVGLVPSGSADPYGLRRLAIGIIRILIERQWNISLKQLVNQACEELKTTSARTANDLYEFLIQRCTNWFSNQGYRADEIEAVFSNNGQSLAILQEKLNSLKTVRGRPEFDSLAGAIKRARNILTQAEQRGFLPKEKELRAEELEGAPERSLMVSLEEIRSRFYPALERREFQEALMSLAPLKGPIDGFFKDVMVMVDDEALRSKRLRLLLHVKDLFDSLVDFSKLQGASPAASTSPSTVNG